MNNDDFKDFSDLFPLRGKFSIKNMENLIIKDEEENLPSTSWITKLIKSLFGKKAPKQYRPPSSEKKKPVYEGF